MKISIADIDSGIRHLELQSDSKTLDLEENFPYQGAVTVKIDINKVGEEIYLQATVSGMAQLTCDRCLKEFEREFTEKTLWIYTTQSELLIDDQDDVFLLEPDQTEIDIYDSVRELLIVILPIKSLCTEECKGLCAGCGVDLNIEKCNCGEPKSDSRWEVLLKLKQNIE